MAQPKRLGFALVGLGHISQRAILPAFAQAQESALIALVSGDRQKAERLALQYASLQSAASQHEDSQSEASQSKDSRYGAPQFFTYDQFEQCLDNPAIGAVYIATSNSTHGKFALQAAARGKHVLCEKPLAGTSQEGRQIVDACRLHGVRLMTAYRKYFEPASVACKQLIASGKLGKLRIIHSSFTNNLPPGDSWHMDAAQAGGGSLMDLGIYCVNTVRWLTGQEPAEASARIWSTDPRRFAAVEENVEFQLQFPGGLSMQGSSSFTAAKSSFIQIHGEKGWAALNPAFAYNEERRLFGKIGGQWFEQHFPPVEEFHLELDHLARCVREGREPEPGGITGLRDVAIIEAIYQAANTGRPVSISLPL